MHRDELDVRRKIARDLLVRAVNRFEERQLEKGAFNIMGARLACETARLLSFDDLASRLGKLLDSITLSPLLDGAITSIERTEEMNSRPLPRATLEEIERRHPPFDPSYVPAVLKDGGAHLQACSERNYERALSLATTELEQVEIALAQALLGDFDAARSAFERFPERKKDLLLVLAIELYRRGQFDEADEIKSAVLTDDQTWAPAYLALGVSGRLPWQLYPFPD